jgi:hypothetical protein
MVKSLPLRSDLTQRSHSFTLPPTTSTCPSDIQSPTTSISNSSIESNSIEFVCSSKADPNGVTRNYDDIVLKRKETLEYYETHL